MLLLGRTSVKLKESTHNRIYVLKAVLNLWENCTDQNCFLFERLIFYLLLGSKYRIGQQTLCKLRGFFPSKTSVGPCQWKKKLKEKVTMPRQFVKLVKTQLYSTISQIIHNEQLTHYMPVSAVLTFTILLNFHYKIY